MKVLIACEFSGIVRDAFTKLGHDAISCDLLPSEKPGKHYERDVRDVLHLGYDLMIAHPPCTYLACAGNRWFNVSRYGNKALERIQLRKKAVKFFLELWNSPIAKIAIENPIGYLSSMFRKPDQIVHPYYFGDPHVKPTCLWLRNLPILTYPVGLQKPMPLGVTIRKPSKYYKGGEIKKHYFSQLARTRGGHERSVTFQGIANAMAQQWGQEADTGEGKK